MVKVKRQRERKTQKDYAVTPHNLYYRIEYCWGQQQNILLVLNLHDLTEHNSGVTIKEGNTGETLAVREGIDDERLDGLEDNLGSLVGLERVRGLELLAASLLTDLPVKGGHTAGRATTADETDRGVTDLELTGDIKSLDLGGEVLDVLEGFISLVDHDITNVGHVGLVKTLDVHTDIVTSLGLVDALVMHLDSEDLTGARVGGGMGREEDDISVRLDGTLLDTAGKDITDTLDLVDTRDRGTHGGVSLTGRELNKVVEGGLEGGDLDFLAGERLGLDTSPPGHVGRLLEEVVTDPARDGEDGDGVRDEVLLPANLGEHIAHLITDFFVTSLLVTGRGLFVHLVDTNEELLDTKKVDKTGVLAGLALNVTSLVVTLLDSGGEVTIGGNHKKSNIGLGGTGNHVLDEITMAGGINDGVMPVIREEFLGGAGDGDTTLTLVLLAIHVEGESEGGLAETVGFLLELLHLTLGDTSELEEKATSGGRLAGIDVTANNDGQMFLSVSHGE